MKKIFNFVIAALCCTFAAQAADKEAILSKIESSNASYSSVSSKFTQIKTLPNKSQIEYAGDFYYCASDKLALVYTNPETDRLIINGQALYMNKDGKTSKYNLEKTASVGSLATSLLNAVNGQVQAVADANNADYTVVEDSKYYIATLSAREKAARGYSKITLYYRKSDCVLETMKMEEFTKVSNIYKLSDAVTNQTVDESVFEF